MFLKCISDEQDNGVQFSLILAKLGHCIVGVSLFLALMTKITSGYYSTPGESSGLLGEIFVVTYFRDIGVQPSLGIILEMKITRI